MAENTTPEDTTGAPALYLQALKQMQACKNKRGRGQVVTAEQLASIVATMAAEPEKFGTMRQALQIAYFLGVTVKGTKYGPIATSATTWKAVWIAHQATTAKKAA